MISLLACAVMAPGIATQVEVAILQGPGHVCSHESAILIKRALVEGQHPDEFLIEGISLLAHAAMYDEPRLVSLALAYGADPNQRFQGQPALVWAIGREECLSLLLFHGATPELRCDHSVFPVGGENAVHVVAMGGPRRIGHTENIWRKRSLRILRDYGANIDTRSSGGRTPLMLAALNANGELVEYLLTLNADINARDDAGETALHKAVISFRDQDDIILTIQVLLAAGADRSAKTHSGQTALDYARTPSVRSVLGQ